MNMCLEIKHFNNQRVFQKELQKNRLYAMTDTEKNKKRKEREEDDISKVEENHHDFWAIMFIHEDRAVGVCFVPYDKMKFDLSKDMWEQADTQMESLYEEEGEDQGYDSFEHLDMFEDAREVAEMFMKFKCVPVAYSYE